MPLHAYFYPVKLKHFIVSEPAPWVKPGWLKLFGFPKLSLYYSSLWENPQYPSKFLMISWLIIFGDPLILEVLLSCCFQDSSSLSFESLITCLIHLFEFILFIVHWASWICWIMSFTKFGEFSDIITSNIFSVSFLSASSGAPTCICWSI